MKSPGLCGPLLVLAAVIASSPHAFACSCVAPIPTSHLASNATAIFVGRVFEIKSPQISSPPPIRNADGTFTVSVGPVSFATQVRFSIERSFKGDKTADVMISRGGTTCDYPFVQNERYLVFAFFTNGVLHADKCERPLPVSQATEALKYLEGIQTNRPQAILYGFAFRQDKDPSGKPVLRATTETYIVHAETAGRSFETTTYEANEFELVVIPGEYRVWLTWNGRTVSDIYSVKLDAGATVLRTLSASF